MFIYDFHPRTPHGLSEPPHRGSSTDLGNPESLNRFINCQVYKHIFEEYIPAHITAMKELNLP